MKEWKHINYLNKDVKTFNFLLKMKEDGLKKL